MGLVGNSVRESENSIVVNGGSRTSVRGPAVSVLDGGSRESQSQPLRSLDHRGMVLIWTVRVFDVEGEEVVVARVRRGVQMFR
jgi:hypothetical protein